MSPFVAKLDSIEYALSGSCLAPEFPTVNHRSLTIISLGPWKIVSSNPNCAQLRRSGHNANLLY